MLVVSIEIVVVGFHIVATYELQGLCMLNVLKALSFDSGWTQQVSVDIYRLVELLYACSFLIRIFTPLIVSSQQFEERSTLWIILMLMIITNDYQCSVDSSTHTTTAVYSIILSICHGLGLGDFSPHTHTLTECGYDKSTHQCFSLCCSVFATQSGYNYVDLVRPLNSSYSISLFISHYQAVKAMVKAWRLC